MTPNTKGALLMMGSMAAFTLNDTLVKVTLQDLPLFQLVALRGFLAVFLIYVLARSLGTLHLNFSRHDKWLVALRCLAELAATFFFLTSLKNMPLANVTAILQALPLTVTLGAALVFFRTGWLATLTGYRRGFRRNASDRKTRARGIQCVFHLCAGCSGFDYSSGPCHATYVSRRAIDAGYVGHFGFHCRGRSNSLGFRRMGSGFGNSGFPGRGGGRVCFAWLFVQRHGHASGGCRIYCAVQIFQPDLGARVGLGRV